MLSKGIGDQETQGRLTTSLNPVGASLFTSESLIFLIDVLMIALITLSENNECKTSNMVPGI
jgi:hypothetical protein